MADPATPIIVPDTPTPVQVQAAFRQLVLGLSGFLSALGFAQAAGKFDLLLQFSGPIAFVLVVIWDQLHTRAERQRLITAARSASDDVAQVTPAGGGGMLALLPVLLTVGLLAATGLGLSACANARMVSAPTAPILALDDAAKLHVRQALAELDIAQHVLLVARDKADAAGLLTGDLRARVFAATRRGGVVDLAVRAAHQAGAAATATTFDAQVAAAYAALADARRLVPQR